MLLHLIKKLKIWGESKEITALKEKIHQLEHIINSIPCNLYWKSKDGTYLGVNQHQLMDLGLTHTHQIIGKKIEEFSTENQQTLGKIIDHDHGVINYGLDRVFEENLKDSGPYRSYLSYKRPLRNKNNHIVGLIGVSIDITKQKEVEKKLSIAISKANTDKKAKDLFIANLSHDIRTPITGMLGLINSLKEEISEKKSSSQFQKVVELENVLYQFLHYFNDILYSIEEPDQGDVHKLENEINLKDIFTSTITLFQSAAEAKDIKIKLFLSEDCPEFIKVNKISLKSVLANIIGNAIKFTKKGHVKLSVDFNRTRSALYISISDTGVGIEKQNIKKIFDRFTKLEQNFSSKFDSSGLGLFMVKKHINALNGKLDVESQVDIGSKFKIEIPISKYTFKKYNPSKKTDTKNTTLLKPLSKSISALIVEDVKLAGIALQQMLMNFNITSELAEDGKKCIQKVKETTYPIIFLDIGLPDIDGIALIKRIKNLKRGKKSIIVFLSGHVTSQLEEKCLKQGAFGVFVKPLMQDQLITLINECRSHLEDDPN